MQSVQRCYKPIIIISAVVLLFMGGQRAWAQGFGDALFEPADIAIQNNGTLVVVDEDRRRRSLVQIDAITGNRITLSDDSTGAGTVFSEPAGILVENEQSLLVLDLAIDAVLRVNAINGDRTVISGCPQTPDPCPVALIGNGPAFVDPMNLARGPDGTIVIVDESLAILMQLDPLTGDRTTISGAGVGTGPAMMAPKDIVSDGTGGWFVTDVGLNAVFQVVPLTGTRTIVSDVAAGIGPVFRFPAAIDVAPDGSLLVVDSLLGALVRVNPTTGDRTVVSDATIGSGPGFLVPVSVRVASNGAVLVVDQSYQAVFAVDAATGNRTVVSRAATLSISPPTGKYMANQTFDMTLIAIGGGNTAINITATLNGDNVLPVLMPCLTQVPLPGGGVAISCPNARELLNLTPGRHVLQVALTLLDNANLTTSPRLIDEAVWDVIRTP